MYHSNALIAFLKSRASLQPRYLLLLPAKQDLLPVHRKHNLKMQAPSVALHFLSSQLVVSNQEHELQRIHSHSTKKVLPADHLIENLKVMDLHCLPLPFLHRPSP